jgi:two-component system sensor histidine kinase ChvG
LIVVAVVALAPLALLAAFDSLERSTGVDVAPRLDRTLSELPEDVSLRDLRLPVARMTLTILPFALALAWWLGRRMVYPLEELERQARARAREAVPGHLLTLDRGDEFGDLADALNALLETLQQRKLSNQAFVADLVHEFKNPVAAIRAASEALEGGVVTEQRAERLARVLRDSSQRLDDLVTRFLDLARAEAGLPDDQRERVDLGALVRGLVAARPGSAVRLEIEGEDQAVVEGVPGRIESVIRNLIDNAESFADPDRPRVLVRLVGGPAVLLSVADNGLGIPEDERAHIFDRFYTKRRTGRGTGLGLALVRAIVEAHGGRVSVGTAQGGGALFEVELPAAAAAPSGSRLR